MDSAGSCFVSSSVQVSLNIIKGRLRIKARTQAATQDSCAMNRLQWFLAGGWAKKNFFFLVVLWAFAACALSNWQSCFLNLQAFFSICSAFLYLIVLWAFAARALSNWLSGFLNLQVFFLFAETLGHRSLCISQDFVQRNFTEMYTLMFIMS